LVTSASRKCAGFLAGLFLRRASNAEWPLHGGALTNRVKMCSPIKGLDEPALDEQLYARSVIDPY
jgi:hypothetical protein